MALHLRLLHQEPLELPEEGHEEPLWVHHYVAEEAFLSVGLLVGLLEVLEL